MTRILNSADTEHVYCTETRPYNQGARLTAYELVHDKLPATLVLDSMVAALLRTRNIAAVVVGADRVRIMHRRSVPKCCKSSKFSISLIKIGHSQSSLQLFVNPYLIIFHTILMLTLLIKYKI